MNKQPPRKNLLSIVQKLTAFFTCFLLLAFFLKRNDFIILLKASPDTPVMVPWDAVLQADQYQLRSSGDNGQIIYTKQSPPIKLVFDQNTETIAKNAFLFDASGQYTMKNGILYVDSALASHIINKQILDTNGTISLIDPDHQNHSWTGQGEGLVAHAAGGINGLAGTNCYEALVTNYNLGHRVFEIDFNMTTDRNLVAVHDWAGYSGMKSTREWADIKIADVFQSMSLYNVLEIMETNRDMFLITDTKSFAYTDEEIREQFQIIYDTAMALDERLLDRIVPQIYNQKMYRIIQSVYHWPSIIYTLYASPDNDQQVIDFVKDKKEIKVITMGPVRYSDAFFQQLRQHDKLAYFFTLNDAEGIREGIRKGAHGFYTDFIIPADMDRIRLSVR